MWAAALGLSFACSTQPQQIQVQPGQAATSTGGQGTGTGNFGNSGQNGGSGDQSQGNNATFNASIPRDAANYVGQSFHYQLTYLQIVQDGSASFNGNSANISVNALPSGQSGTLTLNLYNGTSTTAALSGTNQNVNAMNAAFDAA